jgi:hypothetical protein
MRSLFTVVIVGSILLLLVAMLGTHDTGDDEIANSVSAWVQRSR